MSLVLPDTERAALATAVAGERRVRRWRRYQAVLLVADGQRPEEAAASLGCSRASVYNWLAAWRDGGLAGLVEAPHPQPIRTHTAPLERLLNGLLADDPQRHGHHATGWTIPLLHGEAEGAGIAVSEHTVRRAVRRLGWRWKRPKYVLGRPDPAYEEKRDGHRGGRRDAGSGWERLVRGRDDPARVPALTRCVGAARRAGGGDDQRQECTTGAARGVEHRDGRVGAGRPHPQPGSGQCRPGRRPRGARPGGAGLLVWDNAPPHHTRLARETAEATGIALVPLPFRSPELMPCEDLWRELKRTVAANRVYADVDELAQRGVGWLDERTPDERPRIAGLRSSKFEWLPT